MGPKNAERSTGSTDYYPVGFLDVIYEIVQEPLKTFREYTVTMGSFQNLGGDGRRGVTQQAGKGGSANSRKPWPY